MMRFVAALALVLLCAPSAAPAEVAGTTSKMFYIRGSIGYTTQSMKEFNDFLEGVVDSITGVEAEYIKFGGTWSVAAEAGIRPIKLISVGGGVSYHESTAEFSFFNPFINLLDEMELFYHDITGNVSIWLPWVPGLFVGANAGIGYATFKQKTRYRDDFNPIESFTGQGEYDGEDTVYGAFIGYQFDFPGKFLIYSKAGYRHIKFDKLEGKVTLDDGTVDPNPPSDFYGNPLEFDLSGFYFRVGFGFSVGKL